MSYGDRRGRTAAGALALLLLPGTAMAHGGVIDGPHDLLTTWSLEPFVILGLVLGGAAYIRGLRFVHKRSRSPHIFPRWRTRCALAGVLSLVLALVSPLDPLGEALFSGHMVQHLVLTMIAAPLLVVGDTGTALLWSLPRSARRRVGAALRSRIVRSSWRVMAAPVSAWTLHAAALAVWHMPAPYELALRNDSVHAIEHVSFLATAMLFWWVVAAPRKRQRIGFGAALFYLFTATVASAVLGAAITMASRPWYLAHARSAAAFGLTPLEDQQVAGLIMWVPAGLIYLAALIPFALTALGDRAPVPRLSGPLPR